MLERRMLMLVAALVVLLASAALWNAFVRPPAGVSGGAMPQAASAESVVRVSRPALDSMADPGRTARQPTTGPPPTGLPPVGTGRSARAVQPPCRLQFRRSADPVAYPVRRRAFRADGPAVGRRRTPDRRRRHPRHLRCQRATVRARRRPRARPARDRAPDRPRPL